MYDAVLIIDSGRTTEGVSTRLKENGFFVCIGHTMKEALEIMESPLLSSKKDVLVIIGSKRGIDEKRVHEVQKVCKERGIPAQIQTMTLWKRK